MKLSPSLLDASPVEVTLPIGVRLLAWLNIVVQVLFPLTLVFTPVMVGAREKYFLQQSTQFRTLAHGMNNLQPGDDLDVPVVSTKDQIIDASTGAAQDQQAQKVASVVSQAGSFLANNQNSDTAASMARSMATGAASGEIQQWLSQFGTARVQLETDKNFSLNNSQFDLLVPLYDLSDDLFFTQVSLHLSDERTQANLGVGLRHFMPTYIVGGNLFGDYDLSRDHARMGVGVEYWRNFLKLSTNGYMRLTGWKNSPDLADYQECTANGWDIRLQAWLPTLPQVGGKLTYEKYYGHEVALFGKDNRQQDLYAITAGINYTPLPILTFTAEWRQGESGNNDTLFGINVIYQLGVPWLQQVDPDAVAEQRSLAGSRYDLVERNNDIILEYRKKEVMRLKVANLVTGHAGEQKTLGVSVNSKYGLEHIDWSAPSFISAGGKIVQNGTNYAVVLPDWDAADKGVNSYTIRGVAMDKKGNVSNHSETQVTVLAPDVNKDTSTFTPLKSVLPADGKSTQVLTLTLMNGNGQPVDINPSAITLDDGKPKSATVSTLTHKSAGVYTTILTAGTDIETVKVTPSVQGVTLTPVMVTMISPAAELSQSIIATDKTSYKSGDDMTVTVTLKDASGNGVIGQIPTVTVANATATSGSSWTDHKDGSYTRIYTASTAGTDLKATMKLSGWSTSAQSAAYAITLATEEPDSITVNSYNFPPKAGFPTTGFKGALFTIVPKNNVSPSDYTWTSDAPSWVSVSDGVVSFTGMGTKEKVIITGTPKRKSGKIITWDFTLSSWYLGNGGSIFSFSEAGKYCRNLKDGYNLPTVQQMIGYNKLAKRGTISSLWGEWGNLSRYSSDGFDNVYYWSNDPLHVVILRAGIILNVKNKNKKYNVLCRKAL